jgi:hypothetical protein
MITSSIFYRTLKSHRVDDRFEAIRSSFPHCSILNNYNTHSCDLAIIQGWMKSGSSAPHNELRRRVIERQFKHKKHVLTVDGNIFNYLSKNVYFRYSIDGVFANTGYYFDDMIDPGRWNNISKNTGCILKPWRKTGDHVLILMQKNSGWTMKGEHNLSWCLNTINKIKEYTDRRIVVRLHPTDSHLMDEYVQKLERDNITVSKNKHILEDLKNAWCSITYNSSPGAVSVIEGIPVFIMDLDHKRSPAYDVGNTRLDMLEDPSMIDRTQWIQKISMSHYNIQDIKDGILWNEVLRYFKKLGKI